MALTDIRKINLIKSKYLRFMIQTTELLNLVSETTNEARELTLIQSKQLASAI